MGASNVNVPVMTRLVVDCRRTLSAELVAEVNAFADLVHEELRPAAVELSGAPAGSHAYDGVSVYLVNKWERALRRLDRAESVTIAVASGVCGGLALDVLLATDYRIAGATTVLAPPTGAGGGWPGMAIHRLVNQVGVGRARRLLLFGRPIGAPEARSIGLVDEVAADPAAALTEAVRSLENLSGTELSIRRQLMHEAGRTSFEDALGTHLAACDRTLRLAAVAPQGQPA
jgi:isomerase DpgB